MCNESDNTIVGQFSEIPRRRRHGRQKRSLDSSRKSQDHGVMSDRPLSQTVLKNFEMVQGAMDDKNVY